MSFRDIAQIAGSAMTAQTVRLNTVASNLANAETAGSSEADTYKARKPVFASVFQQGGLSAGPRAGASVRVLDVVESSEPLRKAYEPDNPLANERGEVFYPNVNPVAEMTRRVSRPVAVDDSPMSSPTVLRMTSALHYMTAAFAVFVPLAAGLYLTVTVAWTLVQRMILRRRYPLPITAD